MAHPPPESCLPPRPWLRRAERLRRLLFLLALPALVLASFTSLDLRWGEFLAPEAVHRMGAFIGSFWPPAMERTFLLKTGQAVLETLAMSLLGTVLAAGFGLLLALPASAHGGGLAMLRHGLARLVLNGLRSVPELVWAALLLISAGLGPMPGTLALALHTTGVLGRLFAESIENAPPEPAAALRRCGQGGLPVFIWATLPQIVPQMLAYSLYRWENNIRAATVLGVVGAGGLGQMLYFHLSLFQMAQSATVLLAMMGLVLGVDAISQLMRGRLLR